MTKKELEAEVERLRNENTRLLEALSHPCPVLPPIPAPTPPQWLPQPQYHPPSPPSTIYMGGPPQITQC